MSGRARDPRGHRGQAGGPSARRRDRWLGVGLSLAGHLVVILALVSALTPSRETADPTPMKVTLVDWPPPPTATPLAAAQAPAVAPPPPIAGGASPAPAQIDRPLAVASPIADAGSALSDAQIAGAASAGSGPAGRPCDMPRRLESALGKDPLVQAAVAGSAARAVMVWNGDWVRLNGEDGKGLAAVREAIMWEVAFAPPACRAEPVRGLVLIAVSPAPGSVRLALGSAQWRWSDLLTARGLSGEARVASAD
jgi:hypothetical protein